MQGEQKCEACGKVFDSLRGLNGHKARMHKKGKRAYNHKANASDSKTVSGFQLSYCPCCGQNLRILATALAAMKGL
jgi:hypothetical protein